MCLNCKIYIFSNAFGDKHLDFIDISSNYFSREKKITVFVSMCSYNTRCDKKNYFFKAHRVEPTVRDKGGNGCQNKIDMPRRSSKSKHQSHFTSRSFYGKSR